MLLPCCYSRIEYLSLIQTSALKCSSMPHASSSSKALRARFNSSCIRRSSRTRAYFFLSLRMRNTRSSVRSLPGRDCTSMALSVYLARASESACIACWASQYSRGSQTHHLGDVLGNDVVDEIDCVRQRRRNIAARYQCTTSVRLEDNAAMVHHSKQARTAVEAIEAYPKPYSIWRTEREQRRGLVREQHYRERAATSDRIRTLLGEEPLLGLGDATVGR